MGRTIAFTGGGSGGHVFPGLAVMEELKKRWEGDLVWIGSKQGLERQIVETRGIPYYAVPAGKLRRELSFKNFIDIFKVMGGVGRSFVLLKKLQPAALFSKGGYVSVPPVIAAKMLRIPVVTHESDLDPGLATKINARFADRICVPYVETAAHFPPGLQRKVVVTGNPVRTDIFHGDRSKGRAIAGAPDGKPVLLVLGGSQGATQINELVCSTLEILESRFCIVHQYGPNHTNGMAAMAGKYYPVAFLMDEYSDLLAAADVVLTRAGAGTLWELSVTGKPSILVPLSGTGTRGDQVRNAELFAARGAAVSLGGNPTADEVATAAVRLADDHQARDVMAKAAKAIANADASVRIAEEIYRSATAELNGAAE